MTLPAAVKVMLAFPHSNTTLSLPRTTACSSSTIAATDTLDEAGKLSSIGNTVVGATYTNGIGRAMLEGWWRDPDFDAEERAFYYVRVLEIPTPRWTAYDAKYFGLDVADEIPMITQERAYTSPIWYTP
jgi:hypothetical protein